MNTNKNINVRVGSDIKRLFLEKLKVVSKLLSITTYIKIIVFRTIYDENFANQNLSWYEKFESRGVQKLMIEIKSSLYDYERERNLYTQRMKKANNEGNSAEYKDAKQGYDFADAKIDSLRRQLATLKKQEQKLCSKI